MNEIEKRYRLCENCTERVAAGKCAGKCKEYWKALGAKEQKAIDDAELIKLKKELLLATTLAVKAKEEEMIGKAIQYWDARLRELKQEIREGYDITRPKELIDFKKAMEE